MGMKSKISQLELQIDELPAWMEKLELRKQELATAITAVFPNGNNSSLLREFSLEIAGLDSFPFFKWIVCKQCGKVHIHHIYLTHERCDCYSEGKDCQGNEERLLAAYTWVSAGTL